MYAEIPFWLSLVFILGGLAALAWSSDLFIDGAAALARAIGISPFIVGMVIIGFGTSAPELCVSAMSGFSGHSSLSLGNAYGSCSFNIAVILGVAALICPLVVKPGVAWGAGPLLALISLISFGLLRDGVCSRGEAFVLLAAFFVLLPIYCWFDQRSKRKEVSAESLSESSASGADAATKVSLWVCVFKLLVGLGVLVASSHFLVWGAVDFAKFLGVSDLVIGLTVVAVGTSLPELASAVAAARRGEHEFVLGNIVGSNLFNMLGVVGVATALSPIVSKCPVHGGFSPYIVTRDIPLMIALSVSITLFGVNWRQVKASGVIRRVEALFWLFVFVAYTVLMFYQETQGHVQCNCN